MSPIEDNLKGKVAILPKSQRNFHRGLLNAQRSFCRVRVAHMVKLDDPLRHIKDIKYGVFSQMSELQSSYQLECYGKFYARLLGKGRMLFYPRSHD